MFTPEKASSPSQLGSKRNSCLTEFILNDMASIMEDLLLFVDVEGSALVAHLSSLILKAWQPSADVILLRHENSHAPFHSSDKGNVTKGHTYFKISGFHHYYSHAF